MKYTLKMAAAVLILCPTLLVAADRKPRKPLPLYKDSSAPVGQRVEDLLSRMTLEEKIGQLTQTHTSYVDNENNWVLESPETDVEYGSYIYYYEDPAERNRLQKEALEETRLGIPILFGFDVIHGYRTVYPIPLAQGASFNPELAGEAARVAAKEAYAAGIDWTFSPMIDVARDGRWGRISEGYGEDPYLASVFGAATVKAYQGEDMPLPGNIAACLKHFVAYGASEAGRDYVPTDVPMQALWDTYLPPYEAGIKAGAATVMSAFNTLNGVPASACAFTLKDILRGKYGFDGFVVSDWQSVQQIILQGVAEDGREASRMAFNAGVDMDMTDDLYPRHLASLVASSEVSVADIDESVRRILTLKFRLGLFDDPYRVEDVSSAYLLPEYRNSARELAAESAVLLRNEFSALPLSSVRSIALVGPVAEDRAALMGNWKGRGRSSDVVNIREGLEKEFPGVEILSARGCDFEGDSQEGFEEALELVSRADVAVVCLGEKASWSGENCSRSTIALPVIQEKFLEAVRAKASRVIVLVASGRPVDLVRIAPLADAVLEIWQPGVEGGNAVAGLLSGRYNPSGKLPVTFPYTSGQIPIYYNRRRPARTGGQGTYQDIPSEPLYEFGYGLSYSEFSYGIPSVEGYVPDAGGVVHIPYGSSDFTVSVDVTNTSSVDGKETVLWFVTDPVCSIARPVKELRHFEKRSLAAGETSTWSFTVNPLEDLGFINAEGVKFLEKGLYVISVGDRELKLSLE